MIKYGGSVLIWAFPEAQPMTRIQVHIVLLGGDTGNTSRRAGKRDKEGRKPVKCVVGVFHGCHNELSQTWWLKTM